MIAPAAETVPVEPGHPPPDVRRSYAHVCDMTAQMP